MRVCTLFTVCAQASDRVDSGGFSDFILFQTAAMGIRKSGAVHTKTHSLP